MYFLEKATIKPVTCHATLGLGNDYFQFQSAEVINSWIHLHSKEHSNVLFLLCFVILLILIQNIIIHFAKIFFALKMWNLYIVQCREHWQYKIKCDNILQGIWSFVVFLGCDFPCESSINTLMRSSSLPSLRIGKENTWNSLLYTSYI